jgi:SAM-dependent methyltransferase
MAELACRVCGSGDLTCLGAPLYRPPTKVAGVAIQVDDLNLRLYRCRNCGYQFSAPLVPEERLLACYRESSGKNWTTDAQVDPRIVALRNYARKRALLEQFSPGRRILDFGCYDGGFLRFLDDSWRKSGIEPSTAAAGIASSHSIRILGPTVDAVGPEHNETFDAIVSFDVFEHLGNPVAVLGELRRLLRPGGILLIETGNTDALSWRLIGRAFWYCGIVEHIGFFNQQSLGVAGRLAGLELAHFERSYHMRMPWTLTAGFLPRAAGYYALRALRGLGVRLRGRAGLVAQGTLPANFGDRDHFLAVLRREAESAVSSQQPV